MHHAIPKDCLFTGLIPAGRSSRAAKASLKKATPLGGSASLMALCRPRALKNFEPVAHSSRHQRIPSPAQGRFRGLIFDGGVFLWPGVVWAGLWLAVGPLCRLLPPPQAGFRAALCNLRRLWVIAMRFNSPSVFSVPRSSKRSNPRATVRRQ